MSDKHHKKENQMETKTYIAQDELSGKKYHVDMPHPEIVKDFIMTHFPENYPITLKETYHLAKHHFDLSMTQTEAKIYAGERYHSLFYQKVLYQCFQSLLREHKLKQPGGPKTPYFIN